MTRSSSPPLRLLTTFQLTYPSQRANWVLSVPDRDMWVGASIYDSDQFAVTVPDLDASVLFQVQTVRQKQDITLAMLPSWAHYLAGVAVNLSDKGFRFPCGDMVIAGDEPIGPRYEYSMGMVFGALWYQYNAQPYTQAILIDLMEQIRHDYIDAS